MTKNTTAFAAIALAMTGAAAVASPLVSTLNDAFGSHAASVSTDDILVNADRAFVRADMDENGTLNIDEFAAQAVIDAQLARFNGLVAIDTAETVHINLPMNSPQPLTSGERARIDTVARSQFHVFTTEGEEMNADEYARFQMARFAVADGNQDQKLSGDELVMFAMDMAQMRRAEG